MRVTLPTIPNMYVTFVGGRNSFASFLETIPDELPGKPPSVKEIKEIREGLAPRIILHMLANQKKVFVDKRLLAPVLDDLVCYVPSEMLSRLYCVSGIK